MSQMMFTVLDAERAVHSRAATTFVDVLIPALSDDPETIAELQHAMRRFLPLDQEDREPLAEWAAGDCDEPCDAGICLVDLAGRLIVYQSNFDEFLRRGQVTLDAIDESDPTQARWIPYYIADEWLVTEQLDGWRGTTQQRRQQRQANPPFDSRAVLYGKVAEFIAEQCRAARGGSTDAEGVWTPAVNWPFRELAERAAGKPLHAEDAVAEIHARWLMTPREDLRGRTPREVLQAKRSDLAFHLQDREFQWSNFRQCPPPLWRESTAYRYGGYGTDEIVLYYYLLRHLIHECWEWVVEPSPEQASLTQAEVVERLGASQQEWLHTPNGELCRGKTPAYMIQRERLRLPMGSEGADLMVDCDCPLCQMIADSGPCFWHLDGCGMDEEFPFEMFAGTREEWEEEQRSRAEWNAQWKLEQQELADDENNVVPRLDEEPVEESSPVWQRSFANRRASDSPAVTVFGIGAHLAELIVDLRRTGGSQDWIETLNGDFGNLRAAVADPSSSLVDPVVEKFTEHLAAVSELQPALSAKCQDLERQLYDFARRLNGEADADDELPF